jgi:hypothetical protein
MLYHSLQTYRKLVMLNISLKCKRLQKPANNKDNDDISIHYVDQATAVVNYAYLTIIA